MSNLSLRRAAARRTGHRAILGLLLAVAAEVRPVRAEVNQSFRSPGQLIVRSAEIGDRVRA